MRLLTAARDLRRRKARERGDLFVVEGVRAVEELLASPLRIEGALVSPLLSDTPRGAALRRLLDERSIEVAEVTARDLEAAADTDAPAGVLVLAGIPTRDWRDVRPDPGTGALRVLVLDAVQDPGNVGTMLRTAVALGMHGTVAMPGTVDLWNAKVVRSAMGALFHHPAFASTWDTFDTFRSAQATPAWGADPAGVPVPDPSRPSVMPPTPSRLALIVGNEGHGLTAAGRIRSDQLVAIPIETMESLNVAVVAGILMYVLRPGATGTGS